MKTINYSQPDFYHFSQDSVQLAEYAAKKYPQVTRLLDCYCGSGVVGIEFAFRLKQDCFITGIEKQGKFESHWNLNMRRAMRNGEFIQSELLPLKKDKPFDLILANPPYYLEGDGRLPENPHKRLCHYLKQGEWKNWKIFLRNQSTPHLFLGRRNQPHIVHDKDILCHKELENDVGIFSLK